MILEMVASDDLCIWHSYYGQAGLNNDINVLNNSLLLKDDSPKCPLVVDACGK